MFAVMKNKDHNKHICKVGIFTEIVGGKWKLAILWNIENLTGFTEGKQRLQTTSQKEIELLQKMEKE